MTTVAYASFCCSKDRDRALGSYMRHLESHRHKFDEQIFIFQRCPKGKFRDVVMAEVKETDYARLLNSQGIEYPNEVMDKLTHGWDASHYWAHHIVNHIKAAQIAYSDYIVFADADCYIRDTPAEPSWVSEGIKILEADASLFVVGPNEGGPERLEKIMSQQMFLVNRKRFLEMDFLPWDGTFIDGGPMQEYYFMLEGWIGRYMAANNLWRVVLPPTYRYWHCAWH